MPRTLAPLLLLLLSLSFALAACAGEPFKPCEVSVVNVRPGKDMTARLLGALVGQLAGQDGQPEGTPPIELVVTLKVTNPNDRGVEIKGLSGVVAGPEGELGRFRLPDGRTAPLPAKGSTVVDIVAEPGAGFLRSALPLLLSREKRRDLKATGHVDVTTWLGVRRVEFKDVRLGGG